MPTNTSNTGINISRGLEMFCRKCGANIPDDSQFCLKCGVTVVPPVISAVPTEEIAAAAPALETAPSADVPSSPPPRSDGQVSRQNGSRVLFTVGLVAWLIWALHDLWSYRLFGTVFDLRLWLLGIPLYLLYRRSKNSATKSKLTPMKTSAVVKELKSERAAASRWARLGIFLCVALASAILAAVVFLKGNPSAEEVTEKLTKTSLGLGLAAWGFGEAVAGRWLTLKRTWIAAIALYGIAFVLMAVFLGKPLATKLAELNEDQGQLDRRFTESATGKTLLQPQSFASPQVAAALLMEFKQYAEATDRLNNQKEALLLQRDDPLFRSRWTAYFEATRTAASATEELYRFVAEPSRQVHVENGTVIIADSDGYNKRMDAVNDAMEKLKLASAALGQSVPKERKQEK